MKRTLLAAAFALLASPALPGRAADPPPAAGPIVTKAPHDWIVYDDNSLTPVVDEVSRHLADARMAFDAKDPDRAAAELHQVAAALKEQSARVAEPDKDRTRSQSKRARIAARHLRTTAAKVEAAAAAVEAGKITSVVQFDKTIDKVARSDMERRWLISDVTSWYAVSDEPQRHFTVALAAYAKKDYEATAADIRKATSYLRLEADRASGDAKLELDSSALELDQLADAAGKGVATDAHAMTGAFAKADHALALEERGKAFEFWTRKQYDKAGYELKAAAHGLEGAAGWMGDAAKAGSSKTVAGTRLLGDKLAFGAAWTHEEVAKGFTSLGEGINALGQKIAGSKKAPTVNVGAG